ncbi:calcium/sodium antiporter [Stappia sp.]|uniref:calcium/sodium antiporter n=1 Tax=Stappia sp. TaxID=1870903 RepID=UPI0032D92EB2
MWMDVAFVGLGLVLLFAGGEGLVRGAVSLAARLGVSPLMIGLTVVGFGTSMPELIVSLRAALAGAPDIAVGNVVGSNTANILLILGLTALIAPPPTRLPGLGRDLVVMLVAAFALAALARMGSVERGAGLALLAALAAYLAASAWLARGQDGEAEGLAATLSPLAALAFVGGGLLALMAGADLLVRGASDLARAAGISEAVIGVTVVAVGTSLPELATSIVAAWRRQPEIAVGNVVGSNIFNVLAILGATALVSPLPIAQSIRLIDIPVMLGASLALALLLSTGRRVPRTAGAGLLAAYVGYTAYLFI